MMRLKTSTGIIIKSEAKDVYFFKRTKQGNHPKLLSGEGNSI